MKNYDILKFLEINTKEIKNFGDVLHLSNNLGRYLDIEEIDEEVADAVDNIVRFWNRVDDENNIAIENREPIKIYINSPGGSLLAAFKIIDIMNLSKTPVYTINTGTAYSAGFLIYICGRKRYAYPHASFLFHEGSITMGASDASKFRNYAMFYEKQLNALRRIVLTKTNITEEIYDEHQKDDWWFFVDEALELNICDKKITDLEEV